MSCQSTWFLTLTIVNIISIAVHTFTLFNSYNVLTYSSILLLIVSCCYWAYMYFLEKERSSETTEGQGLISERNTNFMADNVFRYLFVIVIGNTIYCYVFRIHNINTSYKYGNDAINILSQIIFNWYSYTVLPIACIIDFLGRKRNRTPNPKYDLIITLIFIAIISYIDCRSQYFYYQGFDYFIRSVILNSLFMALSYFIYDYILFKMNGGHSYTLCPQETQA